MRTFISFLLFVLSFSLVYAQSVTVKVPCKAWSTEATNSQVFVQIDSLINAGYTVTTVVGLSSASGDSIKNQQLAIARANKYAQQYNVEQMAYLPNTWYYTTEKENRCVHIILEKNENNFLSVDSLDMSSEQEFIASFDSVVSLQHITADTFNHTPIIVLPAQIDLYQCMPCLAEMKRELISRIMLKESKLNWQSNKYGQTGIDNRKTMAKAYQAWSFHKTNLKRCKYKQLRKQKQLPLSQSKAVFTKAQTYKKPNKRIRMKRTRGLSVSGIYRIFPGLSCR